jgi:hypothetical protein
MINPKTATPLAIINPNSNLDCQDIFFCSNVSVEGLNTKVGFFFAMNYK